MSSAAEVIRRYVEARPGPTAATVDHLLSTFEAKDTPEAREDIEVQLEQAGVSLDRRLTGLEREAEVNLSSAHSTRKARPAPWDRPRAGDEAPAPLTALNASSGGTGAGRDRRMGKHLALGAVLLLLAAGAGAGGYLLGKNGGEDLEAAREAGQRQGKREGTARGREKGFTAGLKEGREAGYDETYRPAYVRAYKKAFEDAGLAAPEKVKVRNP